MEVDKTELPVVTGKEIELFMRVFQGLNQDQPPSEDGPLWSVWKWLWELSRR